VKPHEHFCASHDTGERLSDSAAASVAAALECARVVAILDARVRTLPAGAYWYNNDDTCGIGGVDQPCHWHADSEDAARAAAAAAIEKGEV
jgi:hypothetical protein